MAENHISFEEINKAAGDTSPTVDAEWNGLILTIKKRLSLSEMLMFVRDVSEACFADDTGEYLPEAKEFALRCCILESYGGIELPEDITEKYFLVYNSDIAKFITGHIDICQLKDMDWAIDEKINYRKKRDIEALSIKINETADKLDEIENQLVEIFDGISGNDIKNIASAVADGGIGFDEKKLVKAVAESLSEKEKSGDGEE